MKRFRVWSASNFLLSGMLVSGLLIPEGFCRGDWMMNYPAGSVQPLSYDLVMDGDARAQIAYHDGEAFFHASWTGNAWQTTRAYELAGREFYDPIHLSLAVDSGNSPHLAAETPEGLFYAARTGGGWQGEFLPAAARSPVVLIDVQDHVQIVYAVGPTLFRASKIPEGWEYETIGTSRSAYFTFDAALDAEGRIHVCYADEDVLHYVRETPEGWNTDALAGSVVLNPGIVVNPAGGVHMVYQSTSQSVRHVRGAPGNWTTEQITTSSTCTGPAMDREGRLFLLISGSLWEYEDGSWRVRESRLDAVPRGGTVVSDSAGGIHLLTYCMKQEGILFGRLADSSWTYAGHPVQGGTIWIVGGAMDDQCRTHLLYFVSGESQLRHGVWDRGIWTESLTTLPRFSQAEMAIDSSGGLHVAGYSGGAAYAYFDGAGWTMEYLEEDTFVASGGSSNHAPRFSIQVDDTDIPHVTFVSDYTAKYAKRIPAGYWQVEEIGVVSSSSIGAFQVTNLVLDDQGVPHAVYPDYRQEGFPRDPSRLVYAVRNGPNDWTTEDVYLSSRRLDSRSGIALNAEGVHLVFYDFGIYHAKKSQGQWSVQSVDKVSDGHIWDLECDEYGQLQMMYIGNILYPDEAVRRGRYRDGTWILDVVDFPDEDFSLNRSWFGLGREGNARAFLSTGSTAWPQADRGLHVFTEHHYVRSYEAWKRCNFSATELAAGVGTAPGDVSGPGSLTNLERYAFRLPRGEDTALPVEWKLSGRSEPAATFSFQQERGDLTVELRASSDLRNWTTIASSVSGQPFLAAQSAGVFQSGLRLEHLIHVIESPTATSTRFYRFRLTLTP